MGDSSSCLEVRDCRFCIVVLGMSRVLGAEIAAMLLGESTVPSGVERKIDDPRMSRFFHFGVRLTDSGLASFLEVGEASQEEESW